MATEVSNSSSQVAVLEARSLIRSRIKKQAVAEGQPLTELELRMLDSDRLNKGEDRRALNEIEEEYGWQEFMDRISGLLRRAISEDEQADSTAPLRWDELVHRLELSAEDFTLWACCVPAIPGYKSVPGSVARTIIVFSLMFVILAFMIAKALKLF